MNNINLLNYSAVVLITKICMHIHNYIKGVYLTQRAQNKNIYFAQIYAYKEATWLLLVPYTVQKVGTQFSRVGDPDYFTQL